MADLEFRRDLYRGTALDYDRFRVPYPRGLIDDLARRSGATGHGRLLDLACGTGQVTFALAGRFGEVWAVDQEPDMTSLVRQKAKSAGLGHIRVLTSAAEDLPAPRGSSTWSRSATRSTGCPARPSPPAPCAGSGLASSLRCCTAARIRGWGRRRGSRPWPAL